MTITFICMSDYELVYKDDVLIWEGDHHIPADVFDELIPYVPGNPNVYECIRPTELYGVDWEKFDPHNHNEYMKLKKLYYKQRSL